jgi:hypothetical protein
VKLFVCDKFGSQIDQNLEFDIKPFCYIDDIRMVDNPHDADYIVPLVRKYLESCEDFNILRESKLYKDFGERFVFYNLDDVPTCLYEEPNGVKFTAMPVSDWSENMRSNIVMVPLVEEKYLRLSEEEIVKCRLTERIYEYVFVGGVSTSGPMSIRTQRDFVLDFAGRLDSLIVDTTNDKSIFHVKKEWKIDKFHREYMDKVSLGKFGFCPVGQGLNSYRIGECMRIGVVPIIVGHKCLPLEPYIDWKTCSLIFANPEDVTHESIQKQIGDRNYEDMGKLCIDVWEKYFRPDNLCKFLYGEFLEK